MIRPILMKNCLLLLLLYATTMQASSSSSMPERRLPPSKETLLEKSLRNRRIPPPPPPPPDASEKEAEQSKKEQEAEEKEEKNVHPQNEAFSEKQIPPPPPPRHVNDEQSSREEISASEETTKSEGKLMEKPLSPDDRKNTVPGKSVELATKFIKESVERRTEASIQEKLDEISSQSSFRLPPPPPPKQRQEIPKTIAAFERRPRQQEPPGHYMTSQRQWQAAQQQAQQRLPVPPQQQQQQLFTDPRQQQQQQPLYSPPPSQQQQQRNTQQYYQQQYQQRPYPPQQRRPPLQQAMPPPRRRPQRQQPGTLKMLWRRVERSLDELADLEEAVTDRAKQLFTVPNLPSFGQQHKETKDSWTQTPPSGRQRKPAADEDDSSDEEIQPTKAESRAFGHGKPNKQDATGAGKYELYKLYSNGVVAPSDETSGQRTKSPLEDLMTGKAKIIRANGGASQPDNVQQRPAQLGPKQEWREGMTNPFAPEYAGGPPAAGRVDPLMQQPEQQRRSNPLLVNAASTSQSKPFQIVQGRTDQPRPPAYEDEDDELSFMGRLGKFLPPMPHVPSFSRLLGRGDSSYKMYASASLDAWREEDIQSQSGGWRGIFRGKKSLDKSVTFGSGVGRGKILSASSRTPPITDLLSRCDNGKSSSLLSQSDIRKSRSIGRSRASLDVLALGCILIAARGLVPRTSDVSMPRSVSDIISSTVPSIVSALGSSVDGWFYFAVASAFLCSATNRVLNDTRMKQHSSKIRKEIKSATEYGQLYMRLVSSDLIEKPLPERVAYAADTQFVGAVEAARLSSFVTLVLSAILIMTVSVVQPALVGVARALSDTVMLEQWRHWPPAFASLGSEVKHILLQLGKTLRELFAGEVGGLMDHPVRIAFKASFFAVLLAVAYLPTIEQKRPVPPAVASLDDEEETGLHTGSVDNLSRLGVSSASRLGLLSKNGALEANLERWRTTPVVSTGEASYGSVRSKLLLLAYGLLAAIMLALPPVALAFTKMSVGSLSASRIIRLDSILDVSILAIFTLHLAWKALSSVMTSSVARTLVSSFLQSLAKTFADFNQSQYSSQMSLQTAASISSTKGLEISDVWAAHTAKRAWAVRGASFVCRNGEVVAVLGDAGSGKTRLLTAISETMLQPPLSALSTTKVRGAVTVGGLEASKWDRAQLKKRLGLVLNDVRTVTDNAELFSGMTLEEILEPADDMHNPNEPHSLSSNDRACISLAIELSGLSGSLLPRLPSKLSTVVTANEDELRPSPLRPRSSILSPSEWSKLLLARVLAQTILDNDNTAKSSNTIDKCLIGSILLLDDVLIHMSEVEEANLLMALRRTGAATVVSSHKWATGRYADRIVVVKDGAIVEQGTHNELLAMGPNQSVYANKWHAMTSM